MASKLFTVQYSDGSKENIGRTERDREILAGNLKLISGTTYRFTGQPKTYHSMPALEDLRNHIASKQRQEPDCYPGSFIWEHKQRRYHERLESSEAFALRLQTA